MNYWNKTPDTTDVRGSFDHSAQPLLMVDVEKYQSFLDDSDMTDAQKEEFLKALWSIIVNFVEMGFGVHPLQEACGQNSEKRTECAKTEFDAVKSDASEHTKNNDENSP